MLCIFLLRAFASLVYCIAFNLIFSEFFIMATTNNKSQNNTTTLFPPPTHIHKTQSSQSSKVNLQQLLNDNNAPYNCPTNPSFFRKRSNSDPQEVTKDLVDSIKQKLARMSTVVDQHNDSVRNGVFCFHLYVSLLNVLT